MLSLRPLSRNAASVVFVLGNVKKMSIASCYIAQLLRLFTLHVGGPGVGKGTQCSRLATECDLEHISAGELLRKEQLTGSHWGRVITDHLVIGKIVPVEITLSLLKQHMLRSPKRAILVDGFPRNWDNLHGWNAAVAPNEAVVETVVWLDSPMDTLFNRIMRRAASSGRDDDNEKSFRDRYATYEADTLPVVRHFEDKGVLRRIDGDQTADEVYKDIKKALSKFISNNTESTRQNVSRPSKVASNCPIVASNQ